MLNGRAGENASTDILSWVVQMKSSGPEFQLENGPIQDWDGWLLVKLEGIISQRQIQKFGKFCRMQENISNVQKMVVVLVVRELPMEEFMLPECVLIIYRDVEPELVQKLSFVRTQQMEGILRIIRKFLDIRILIGI